MRVILASGAVLLFALAAGAEDNPRDFFITVDAKGSITTDGKVVDTKQLEEALLAREKALPPHSYPNSEIRMRITCDPAMPASAFREILGAAEKIRPWAFQVRMGEEFILFRLPIDEGIFAEPHPDGPFLVHLCSSGDAAGHAENDGKHVTGAADAAKGGKAWIWSSEKGMKPTEIGADMEAATILGRKLAGMWRDVEFRVDSGIPMKYLFALLTEVSGGKRYKLADEESLFQEENPWEELSAIELTVRILDGKGKDGGGRESK